MNFKRKRGRNTGQGKQRHRRAKEMFKRAERTKQRRAGIAFVRATRGFMAKATPSERQEWDAIANG